MQTKLEKKIKKNLVLTYVEKEKKVIYSFEYQGRFYQESVPIEEYVKSCQNAINQELLDEKEIHYLSIIDKISKKIKDDLDDNAF